MQTTPRKRGRPAKPYKASNGNYINGLRRRADGRWIVIGTGQSFREPDERLAIAHFHRLTTGRDQARLSIPIDRDEEAAEVIEFVLRSELGVGEHLSPDGTHRLLIPPSIADPVQLLQLVPEDVLWTHIREQIITRPQYVAERTGIEQIGYLTDIKKPTPSPTLDDLWNLFAAKTITPNWKAKCKAAWLEFSAAVGVETLRQITQEQIVDYADLVAEQDNDTAVKQKFGAVKSIINWPTKKAKWSNDCKRVLALCGCLVKPRSSVADPRPIEHNDLHAILAKTDDVMRAACLCMLNFCMYGGEVVAIDWTEINFKAATLVTRRSKTGQIRVATVWSETIASLEVIRPATAIGPVFLNSINTRMDYLSLRRRFEPLRVAAGRPRVQLAQFRDGAYTAAIEGGATEHTAKLLAGHSTGIQDKYVKRNPKMVANACDAVYRAYGPFRI